MKDIKNKVKGLENTTTIAVVVISDVVYSDYSSVYII